MTENENNENDEFGPIILVVGSRTETRDGRTDRDERFKITFRGYLCAERTFGDSRGQTVLVLACPDGRNRVHVKNWSRWQGEGEHAYMACEHGEDCPEEPNACKDTLLTDEQVGARWPWAREALGLGPVNLDV